MISEDRFLELPKCEKCANRGVYQIRCNSPEQQDEYGVPAGEIVQVTCSRCRLHRRRREMFLKNKAFQNKLSFFELSDYFIPPGPNYNSAQSAIDTVNGWFENLDTLLGFGGFIYITGKSDSGKSVLSHTIARECYLGGYLVNSVSIADLSIDLSHRFVGTVVTDNAGKVVFDLEDYAGIDLLIIDDFHLINTYFHKPDVRRAMILRLFRDRLKNGKTTIVISKDLLSVLFSADMQQTSGVPYDFPTVITKNYKVLKLNGGFQKEKK